MFKKLQSRASLYGLVLSPKNQDGNYVLESYQCRHRARKLTDIEYAIDFYSTENRFPGQRAVRCPNTGKLLKSIENPWQKA